MFDKVEKIGKSLIQHGPKNDRIYLIQLHPDDLRGIANRLKDISLVYRYTKVITKVPEWALDTFLKESYEVEATIPGLYDGSQSGYFMARYFGASRGFVSHAKKAQIKKTKEAALRPFPESLPKLPNKYSIRKLDESNLSDLAKLYKSVFEQYPFPINQIKYLRKSQKEQMDYFGVFSENELVAASSMEKDLGAQNAEVSDFATINSHRGKALSYFLLQRMEQEMMKKNILTVYSIARATSLPMNKTFSRSKYKLAGTLTNNSCIGKEVENMNVWHRKLNIS